MNQPDTTVVCLLNNDPSQLEATNGVLSAAGWKTRPFTDADAFLEYARVHSPEVAILDFGGARSCGLQIRSRLRDVSPGTWAIIGLKPHHNPAHQLLPDKELIDLLKQYVGASHRRFHPTRSFARSTEGAVGLRA